jgi:hypothetical protein
MRVAVGPDAMMVASRGAPHAYSEDASTWFAVDSQLDATWGGPSGTVVYSEELGFVTIVEGSGNILRMADDKVWELAGHVPAEVGLTTDVAASKDKILVKAGPRLWVWTD